MLIYWYWQQGIIKYISVMDFTACAWGVSVMLMQTNAYVLLPNMKCKNEN